MEKNKLHETISFILTLDMDDLEDVAAAVKTRKDTLRSRMPKGRSGFSNLFG